VNFQSGAHSAIADARITHTLGKIRNEILAGKRELLDVNRVPKPSFINHV